VNFSTFACVFEKNKVRTWQRRRKEEADMARGAPTLHVSGESLVVHVGEGSPLPTDWRDWLDLLPDDLRDAYEERAALIEFDGGEKRRTAERRAFECVVWRDARARSRLAAPRMPAPAGAPGDAGCAQVLAGAGA